MGIIHSLIQAFFHSWEARQQLSSSAINHVYLHIKKHGTAASDSVAAVVFMMHGKTMHTSNNCGCHTYIASLAVLRANVILLFNDCDILPAPPAGVSRDTGRTALWSQARKVASSHSARPKRTNQLTLLRGVQQLSPVRQQRMRIGGENVLSLLSLCCVLACANLWSSSQSFGSSGWQICSPPDLHHR